MSSEDWARTARTGVGWSLTSFAAGRALTFVATMILARLLVPAEFGVVAAILVFLSLLELASDLGMKSTVIYEQERGLSHRLDAAFTINLGLAIGLFALAVILAPAVATLFAVGGEADLFRLAAASLLITSFGNIHDAILLRELAFRRRIVPELARGLVRGGVSVGLALGGAGAVSLVVGMLAGQVAWTAVLWVLSRYRPRLRFDREMARSMISYGSGAVALDVISVVGTRADTVVVARALGASALGVYSIAYRLPDLLISSVAWRVSKVVFPALSQVRSRDRTALPEATLALLRYQALGALPVAATLAVLAPAAIVVLFSDQWREGAGVMAAIAVAAGLSALSFPLGDVFKAIGRQRTLVAINLVNLPLFVGAMIAVAPRGIVWVAWATATATLIHLLMVAGAVAMAIRLRVADLLRAIGPALAAAGGCGLGAAAVRLAWPDLALVPLLAGSLAALAGGTIILRALAPRTFALIYRLAVAGLAARRRGGRGAGAPTAERLASEGGV
jgi:lipopolysaccharide exporter